jgi:predicted DNA-binding transcriptional regulator AlpA
MNPALAELQDDPLLTDYDLERLTQQARSTWQKRRLTGDGPPFVKIGRSVRYPSSGVKAWLAARPRLLSTSDPRHTPESGGA